MSTDIPSGSDPVYNRPIMKRFPRYPARAHATGQARITMAGRTVYLGLHGSMESWERYRQLMAEWQAMGHAVPAPAMAMAPTVADVVVDWIRHAETNRTNPDGSRPWNEIRTYRMAVGPLLDLHGSTLAKDFGPRMLKAVRAAMVGRAWCRNVVNRHVGRIQTIFRWAESEELVPGGVYAALATVSGLLPHEGGSRETGKVPPAPPAAVRACRPHLTAVVRAMVWLLQLTGARPGELVRWTPRDVIQGGKVEVAPGSWADIGAAWCVRLARHKTESGGVDRYILIGPRARRLLRALLRGRSLDAPLFSPVESVQRGLARRPRRRGRPSRRLTFAAFATSKRLYTAATLTNAIRDACTAAGVAPWSAYQLRHSAITEAGGQADAEAARIIGGHRSLGVTRRYLVDDLARAARVIEKIG